MFVSATSILNGVKEYPNNVLIQAILPKLQEVALTHRLV